MLFRSLLPVRPLDGAEAWKLLGELRDRWGSGRLGGPSRWRMPRFRWPERKERRPEVSPDEARRIAKAFEDAVRRR